ncbi:N-6 DNA methylase, partial [Lactobacillus crispatus]|uniref:N-6 DNA methylase n=1 Tax=Lactobacillus crispatus TaxID=47770 RepID=UPI001F116B0A
MIMALLQPNFTKQALWQPKNGESLIHKIYVQVYNDMLPLLESNLHLDFTGKILNSLNDWVSIDNDRQNDVVLTPRYITSMMTRLDHTDKDTSVRDLAIRSAGFLVTAMDIMVKDAKNTNQDKQEHE